MKSNIIIKLEYAATHNWETCDLEEVSYLKHEHRHVFHITLKKEVTHDDRDIEFIVFKNNVSQYLNEKYNGKLGSMSCEMLARHLVEEFDLVYCSVLEDNENGAEIINI